GIDAPGFSPGYEYRLGIIPERHAPGFCPGGITVTGGSPDCVSVPVVYLLSRAGRLRDELAEYAGGIMATGTAVITEKYVEMSHGKTRYYEAGAGYPLILIHGAGFLGGADTWLGVIHPLAERHRVLAVDCLNWGMGDVFN